MQINCSNVTLMTFLHKSYYNLSQKKSERYVHIYAHNSHFNSHRLSTSLNKKNLLKMLFKIVSSLSHFESCLRQLFWCNTKQEIVFFSERGKSWWSQNICLRRNTKTFTDKVRKKDILKLIR